MTSVAFARSIPTSAASDIWSSAPSRSSAVITLYCTGVMPNRAHPSRKSAMWI